MATKITFCTATPGVWGCCVPRRLIYSFERTKDQLKSLNIPQVIRDLHEQLEQPTKYQLFSFKTHFKFILQNHLGIYETCICRQELLFLANSYKERRARRKIFLAKNYLKRINMYLASSRLNSHWGTHFCMMEISWWTISVCSEGKRESKWTSTTHNSRFWSRAGKPSNFPLLLIILIGGIFKFPFVPLYVNMEKLGKRTFLCLYSSFLFAMKEHRTSLICERNFATCVFSFAIKENRTSLIWERNFALSVFSVIFQCLALSRFYSD